ncbi:MAG: sodium:proton antiporter [Phycisphaera sp.]|nr:sodium:proton antiporter [Phycisphaera sp.]
MEYVIEILTWLCLLTGGFFCMVGGLGLIRLPDFYSRTHAGGITDTLGAGMIIVGLMFQTFVQPHGWHWMAFVKLWGILAFLFFTSPTGGHALVRAAFSHGLRPQLSGEAFDESLMEGENCPVPGGSLSTLGDAGTADDHGAGADHDADDEGGATSA